METQLSTEPSSDEIAYAVSFVFAHGFKSAPALLSNAKSFFLALSSIDRPFWTNIFKLSENYSHEPDKLVQKRFYIIKAILTLILELLPDSDWPHNLINLTRKSLFISAVSIDRKELPQLRKLRTDCASNLTKKTPKLSVICSYFKFGVCNGKHPISDISKWPSPEDCKTHFEYKTTQPSVFLPERTSEFFDGLQKQLAQRGWSCMMPPIKKTQ